MKTTALVLSICFLRRLQQGTAAVRRGGELSERVDEGVCASMSEVYEYTLDERPARHPKHLSKEKEAK